MRKVQYKENKFIEPCPECGNNTEFNIHSQQVAEDCCDVWVKCKCGFDPTAEDTMNRLEDVWGSLDNGTCQDAIVFTWNDILREKAETDVS